MVVVSVIGVVVVVVVEAPAGAGVDPAAVVDELPPALPTMEPVPQAMVWPLGWVGFGGGVVAPVVEAMVKRVVHCLSDAPRAVNW